MISEKKSSWPIQTQIVLVLSICIISITLATAWGTAWWTNRVSTDHFISDKQQFVELLAASSKLALLFDSPELAKEALIPINLNKRVIHAWIIDANGNILAQHSHGDTKTLAIPTKFIDQGYDAETFKSFIDIRKKIFGDEEPATQNEPDNDFNLIDDELTKNLANNHIDNNQSLAGRRTASKNETPLLVGELYVRFSSEALKDINGNIIYGILGITAVLTPFFLILGLWLSKKVSHPLEKLAAQMTKWDQSHSIILSDKESISEINTLIDAFNLLMFRLNSKTDELESSYARLIAESSDKERMQNERNELEHRLNQSQKMEAIGHLTSGIAHDFNNILGSILGFSQLAHELVEDDESLERVCRYISEVRAAGDRARDIVSQLLTLSRENKNEQHVFTIGSEIKKVVDFLSPMIPANISLNNHIDASQDACIKFNRSEFSQAIMNLCINARDAITAPGEINLSMTEERFSGNAYCASCHETISGEFLCLKVEDTGSGIAPEHIESIFNPFFSTKEKDKGTGLGLSMVHGVVHKNGGHIIINSQPGRFCQFAILLKPVSEKLIEEPNVTLLPTPKSPSQLNCTIMIVDDDKQLLRFLAESLKDAGCEVYEHSDSQCALAEVKQAPNKFDLIITDEIMPNLTGIELIGKLSENNINIPTIVCTGYTQHGQSDYQQYPNVLQILRKPLLKSDIVLAIEDALAVSHNTAQRLAEAP